MVGFRDLHDGDRPHATVVADHTLYVQAQDEAGNWSASGTFTISIDQAIPDSVEPPGTPDPSTGSLLLDMTPLLDWEDVAYAEKYRLQTNTVSDFSGTTVEDDSNVTDLDYQGIDDLTYGETYYWRVKTRSLLGIWSESWSTVWRFSVRDTWAVAMGGSDYESVNSIIETTDGGHDRVYLLVRHLRRHLRRKNGYPSGK